MQQISPDVLFAYSIDHGGKNGVWEVNPLVSGLGGAVQAAGRRPRPRRSTRSAPCPRRRRLLRPRPWEVAGVPQGRKNQPEHGTRCHEQAYGHTR
jgi:hypothetical protein